MLCSVGTIRGFDRDGDALVDFQEKSGWVGLVVAQLLWHGPIVEEVDDTGQSMHHHPGHPVETNRDTDDEQLAKALLSSTEIDEDDEQLAKALSLSMEVDEDDELNPAY